MSSCVWLCVRTNLNSPLLFETRSGMQYLAELSNTTMWTILVLLPLLVLTRHSQSPVKPGWMFEIVSALMERKHDKRKCFYHVLLSDLTLHKLLERWMYMLIPCNQGAVLHHMFLNKYALGGVGLDHATVLVPQHLHVLGYKGGLTLEGQAVPLEDDLAVGWSQLEGGQLERCI